MKRYITTSIVHDVHTVHPVHHFGQWTRDNRYPSRRCIPVRRHIPFNPKGR